MSLQIAPNLLATCEREPIHIPEAIQPHGVLLVVDPVSRRLLALAGDEHGILDGSANELVEEMLCSHDRDDAGFVVHTFMRGGQSLQVTQHRSGDFIVMEVERATSALTAVEALGIVNGMATRLEQSHSVEEICQVAAEAVHAMTAYARVMVYRFLADGSGAVIAEAKDAGLQTFLNHHFPESDIPQQARALYARNHVRVIPDAGYAPASLRWLAAESNVSPLDMSDAHLRSVSPIHLQYLKNMGVVASASISIMVGEKLWGLIACHNPDPRPLDYVERELCRHVGQQVGVHINARLRAATQVETLHLMQRREEVLQVLLSVGSVEDSLLRHVGEVQKAIPCDGVAVRVGDKIALAGSTPTREEVMQLVAAIGADPLGEPFASHRLGDRFAFADGYAAKASGALGIRIRNEPRIGVCWFRAERQETINWAGNPHKAVDATSGALTPRTSFEAWKETVRGEARRWTAAEVDAAARFRSAVLEVIDQRELQALNQQLRRALGDREELLEQKDLLMREIHHRVQNSLQLVNSILFLQARESKNDDVRGQFELASQRLSAIAMVHRRLWRADKLGDVRLDTFMAELTSELAVLWGPEWADNIELELAPLTVSTDQGVILGLLVTELMTNAVKYAYAGLPGPLLVKVREDEGCIHLVVADRGTGLMPENKASFGSKLIDRLVRQLNGTLRYQDNRPGLRTTLTLSL